MDNDPHIRVLLAYLKGEGTFVCASEKRAEFELPKKYYSIKVGIRLRKVHLRLVTTTYMPLSDLPLFLTLISCICWQIKQSDSR